MPEHLSPARRVNSVAEITQPGDYFLNPHGDGNEAGRSLWFCLPIDIPGEMGWCHRITEPPWTFTEQPDGSVEVRASILTYEPPEHRVERWHGYLDAGNVWRRI